MVMRKKTLLDDPKYDKQCAWNDHGYRCQNMGHMSQSIVGGGPWYCRQHFAELSGWPAYTAPVVDESMESVDARVNKIVPRNGDSEHVWSMRCKAWVLGRIKRGVLRQPGEDQEAA